MNLNSYLSQLRGKTVLVTGGTGFTGSVLLKKLVEIGASVRAIARASSDCSAFDGLPIQWFRANVYEQDAIAKATEQVEYVFHVAAAFRQAKIEDQEYHRVHVESTKHLAEACAKNSRFQRFVHVSTMGVHGHIENPPGDESSPFAPGDIYQRTKLEAEHWLRDFSAARGLPFAIIRPTAIYGPGDRRLLKVFKMVRWPLFPILGQGKCLYHLVHVDDLTDAIALAAVHPSAAGEAFLVGDSQAIPLATMAEIIADELNTPLRVVRIPVGPFFVAADVCELVCRPLGVEPPLYRRRVAFYTKDRSFSVEKIKQRLDFTPRWSTDAGLRQTARWYVEQGWL
ncbi:MAG: NAD-dependent epimerase/dehydratase family protein [Bdellovibrionales bacterium]|nr:NAD-dependent epimerase/dehydratase family protein [Bdellovibrionales bacterium]